MRLYTVYEYNLRQVPLLVKWKITSPGKQAS